MFKLFKAALQLRDAAHPLGQRLTRSWGLPALLLPVPTSPDGTHSANEMQGKKGQWYC